MPELPVYQSQQRYTTQSSGARVDVSAAGAPGRAIRRQGAGIVNLAEGLVKIQDGWAKARVSNQYTTARNERKARLNDIMFQAGEDSNRDNVSQYIHEIDDLKSQDIEIDDDNVKSVFESETELDVSLANTKIQSIFRQKLISHQRGEIMKDGDVSQSDYVGSQSIVMRANILGAYKSRLKAYMTTGFMTNTEYLSEIKETEQWEFNRAMKDVGKDPQGTVENLKQYKFSDDKQKNEIVNMARINIARQGKIRAIAQLQKHSANEAELSMSIFEDNETPISDKIIKINELETLGEISEGFAVKSRRYLKSVENVDSITGNVETAKIVRMMYDANVGFEGAFPDEQSYLRKIQAIQGEIMASPNLSGKDRVTLQKELNTITKKKMAEATVMLKGDTTSIYAQADKLFQDAIPEHMRDEALRDFFFKTAGQEVNEQQVKVIVEQVAAQVVGRNRSVEQDAWDFAREEEGNDADLRKEKHSSGVWAINLWKDGKRVRTVKEIGGK